MPDDALEIEADDAHPRVVVVRTFYSTVEGRIGHVDLKSTDRSVKRIAKSEGSINYIMRI